MPFLNGGLFEESAKQTQTERLQQARLRIRNSTFKAIFDDLLERFNFTVTEDTPLDVEVAIDPEMLGKIFESLILQLEKDPDKDLRKLTGSYYTPRPVVHFMCQEALKEYLVTQLSGDDSTKAETAREKVDALLGLPPADHLDDEQVKELARLFTPAEAKMLRQAILDCRACDPAVGSGAFPVGMLHEMVAAVARLDLGLHGKDFLTRRNYDYDLKKQIIESCLYGVDIQEQAVRLCELRLWLSLVVDYEIDLTKPFARVIREIPSLPNLSYRIVRGDSLLERLFGHVVQLDQMARDAKTKQLVESIQADKQSYFRETNTPEKRRLELKILAKQADLAECLIEAKRAGMKTYQINLFGEDAMTAKDRKAKAEYEAQAAELGDLKARVAGAKSKLQRLVGQKRLVNCGDLDTLRRQYFHTGDAPTFMWQVDFAEVFSGKGGFDLIVANPPYGIVFDESHKDALLHHYRSFVRNNDVYAAFADLSARLLNPRCAFVLIMPNTYLTGPYFVPLKEELLLRGRPVRVTDFGIIKVFPDPNVFTAILRFRKVSSTPAVPHHVEPLMFDTAAVGPGDLTVLSTTTVPQYAEEPYVWAPTTSLEQKLTDKSSTLDTWCEVKDIGFNYWTKGRGKKRGGSIGSRVLYSGSRINRRDTPFIKGVHIQPFLISESNHFLRHDYESYLDPERDVFRFTPAYLERVPKIVYRQTADRIVAAIDREARYTDKTVHLIVGKNDVSLPCSYEYLLGILNSQVITYIYRQRAREEGRLFAQVKVFRVKSLPVLIGSERQQEEVEEIVLNLEKRDLSEDIRQELESNLNNLVNQIYGLTRDEIESMRSQV